LPDIEPSNSPAETAVSQRVAALVQSLKSPDVQERRRAIAALNAMRTQALPAVPALREALKDADSEVRTWAALSLISNRVNDKAAVPILIQVLRHENPTLRQVACLSLAMIPYEEAEKEPVIAALTECMGNDSNAEVKNAALSALKMVTSNPSTGGK
jgi:HEAT repeat protein